MTVTGATDDDLDDLELEVRALPGIVSVGLVPPAADRPALLSVVAVSPGPTLREEIRQIADLHLVDATVEISGLELREAASGTVAPTTASPAAGETEKARVVLRRAVFADGAGICEVTLALPQREGVGQVSMGPLIGGAAATLAALEDLGYAVPFYLQSAYRANALPDAPVVVVLRTLDGRNDRIGVALADSDVESAARATLSAVNRELTR